MSQQSRAEKHREKVLSQSRKNATYATRIAELNRAGHSGYITRYTPSRRALHTNLAYVNDMKILKHKKHMSDLLPNIILVICLVFVIVCVILMGTHQENLAQADDQMQTVADTFTTTPQTPDETNLPPAVDFAALQKINPDVAGWIYIPGTSVDYPIMYSTEKEKYLRKNIWGNYEVSGSIFADWNDSASLTDEHLVLYGHHLPWDSMFTSVSKYLTDPEFFNEHRTVYIETPETTYVLSVIGTHKVQPTAVNEVDVKFSDENGFQSLVDAKLAADQHEGTDTGDYDRSTIGKMVSLVTCADNGTARSITECIPVSEYPTALVAQVRQAADAAQSSISVSQETINQTSNQAAQDVAESNAASNDNVSSDSDMASDSNADGNTSGSQQDENGQQSSEHDSVDSVESKKSESSESDNGIIGYIRSMSDKLISWIDQIQYDLATMDDNDSGFF